MAVNNRLSPKILASKNRDEERKRAKREFDDFTTDHFDMKMLIDYFKLGVKARVFKDKKEKILKESDDLYAGFRAGNFLYTFRRQKLIKK